ncbi:zinc finger E-box-binding homeobox 2-like isoform X2 [Rhinatrema bivittatum]|uniref:zinc finger E-box-binding homeobox 2-like isoform X2 n=1 Tax=Rhinatrema bivittatum TaxID=194408 RepID=UPI001127B3DA|nr:zinc finger E-box-binding homeobox 2-like isoform X2 [Rhinatrema bivittatum]
MQRFSPACCYQREPAAGIPGGGGRQQEQRQSMEEEPRGTRRKQAKPRRSQGENKGKMIKGRVSLKEGEEEEEEEEEDEANEQLLDYISYNSTEVIYPEAPEEGSPASMALQDDFARLLSCPYCEQEYRCHTSLSNHVRHCHGREETFVCSLCGCIVHCKSHLKQHMATHVTPGPVSALKQHTGDQSTENRKFKCPECGKAFKYKHHLKEHLRIHSGEKPYECPKCKKRFSHSGSYSSHLSNKKCLPPETAEKSVADEIRKLSSPVSMSSCASPAHSSVSPHRPQASVQQQPNGFPRTRNGSLHCSDAIKNFAWLGLHVSVLQNTMQGLPVDPETHPLYTLPGESPINVLQYLSHPRGKKNYYDSMPNLKTGKENGLGVCAETGLKKAGSFETNYGCQADGNTTAATLYYRNREFCGKGGKASFGGLQSLGKHTSPEYDYTGDQQIPILPLSTQTIGNGDHSTALNLKTNYVELTSLSSLDRDGENCMENRIGDWSQCSFPPVYEKRKLYELELGPTSSRTSTDMPLVTEHQLVEAAQDNPSTKSTLVASRINHQSILPVFNRTKSSTNGLRCTPKMSTSKEMQAEPLDLSLPKSGKELHVSSSAKNRMDATAQIQMMEDNLLPMVKNKSNNQSTETMLKYNILYPDSPYSALCGFLPSTLNNFLQERCPVLHINPEFHGLQFLPYTTYLYGAQPTHMMSHKLQEKHVHSEFFSRGEKELPALLDEGTEGESSLARKRLRRTEEGLYACDLCDKTFQKSSSLLRHKYEHTGKRPHQCETCQKAFKHKHHLIEHLRLHSGEKPYQCNKCGKRFSHSGSYSQHMNHRYAYCRKEGSRALTSMEESPGRATSPGNQSGDSEHELDHLDDQSGENQLGKQSGARHPKLDCLSDQSEDSQPKLGCPDDQLPDHSGDRHDLVLPGNQSRGRLLELAHKGVFHLYDVRCNPEHSTQAACEEIVQRQVSDAAE